MPQGKKNGRTRLAQEWRLLRSTIASPFYRTRTGQRRATPWTFSGCSRTQHARHAIRTTITKRQHTPECDRRARAKEKMALHDWRCRTGDTSVRVACCMLLRVCSKTHPSALAALLTSALWSVSNRTPSKKFAVAANMIAE